MKVVFIDAKASFDIAKLKKKISSKFKKGKFQNQELRNQNSVALILLNYVTDSYFEPVQARGSVMP